MLICAIYAQGIYAQGILKTAISTGTKHVFCVAIIQTRRRARAGPEAKKWTNSPHRYYKKRFLLEFEKIKSYNLY